MQATQRNAAPPLNLKSDKFYTKNVSTQAYAKMSLVTRINGGGDDDSASGGIETQKTSPSIGEVTAITDELQDGDNSLEPGELVTPPHQQPGNASPALKKMLAKDVMSKTLRKLTQIDTDKCEENERAVLELETIRRKEVTSKMSPEMPIKTYPMENGTAAHTVATSTGTSTDDADDSEGLYSDTDSSAEEQTNLEDVQKARKEKQAEAAAAAVPLIPPPRASGHPFHGLNQLRFHMRPPCIDYSRRGFMPRMMRGGMRAMPPMFFNRPSVFNRGPTPRGTPPPQLSSVSQINGPQGQASLSSGSYGPVLPPSQAQGQPQASKRTQSDVM